MVRVGLADTWSVHSVLRISLKSQEVDFANLVNAFCHTGMQNNYLENSEKPTTSLAKILKAPRGHLNVTVGKQERGVEGERVVIGRARGREIPVLLRYCSVVLILADTAVAFSVTALRRIVGQDSVRLAVLCRELWEGAGRGEVGGEK